MMSELCGRPIPNVKLGLVVTPVCRSQLLIHEAVRRERELKVTFFHFYFIIIIIMIFSLHKRVKSSIFHRRTDGVFPLLICNLRRLFCSQLEQVKVFRRQMWFKWYIFMCDESYHQYPNQKLELVELFRAEARGNFPLWCDNLGWCPTMMWQLGVMSHYCVTTRCVCPTMVWQLGVMSYFNVTNKDNSLRWTLVILLHSDVRMRCNISLWCENRQLCFITRSALQSPVYSQVTLYNYNI